MYSISLRGSNLEREREREREREARRRHVKVLSYVSRSNEEIYEMKYPPELARDTPV